MLTALLCSSALSALADQTDEEFFESKIRPLLIDNCYECHRDGKKTKGGLRLDLKAGWEQGGDSGPAIVPGHPEQSLLIKAVGYQDEDLKMPPKDKKLSDEQIALLTEWIQRGAYDPRNGELVETKNRSDHWAFQPVRNPPIPEVKHGRSIGNDLDPFILEQLEAHQIDPSPRADARTLIRRTFHDVIGLPPTPEEVFTFEQDSSREAYERLIDDLLSRPQYGERWARHWLDVARYADTKGYVFEEERRYAYAYTFRNYVVDAFNDDLPFDRFIVQQIAADQLDLGDNKRPLAAMGYLTVGRRFLNNQTDIIDDRIDVVTRGMMGLTVTCARCHDHKFDPIPTADYYSLYGVFASSNEPEEKPLIGITPPQFDAYLKEHERRVAERDKHIAKVNEAIQEKLRSSVGDYLLTAHEASLMAERGPQENLAKSRQLDFKVLQSWMKSTDEWSKATNPIFSAWNEFRTNAVDGDADISKSIKTLTENPLSTPVNPLVWQSITNANPSTLKTLADAYGALFAEIAEEWEAATRQISGATGFNESDKESLRVVLYGTDMPFDLNDGELRRMYDVPQGQRARALQREIEELDATHEGAPPRAMVMNDNPTPYDPHIFKRGQAGVNGDAVPRQFLEILSPEDRKPFEKGSGRLELAEAIASDTNPLTARVIVNRVWMQYFNRPLVDTPSDFGVRSDPPSHPDLLDHLAWTFMHEDKWSLKKLHRRILLSAVYQQASMETAEARASDQDNRFYWRQNRKRLGFEDMRDSLLAVGGNLDSTIGGRSVEIDGKNYSTRRSIYGNIDRQNLPGMFRTFDLASPDTSSAGRFTTTVPQQALFLMNSPFIAGESRALANRAGADDEAQNAEKTIRELYQLAVQRQPTDREFNRALRFVTSEQSRPEPEPEVPDWQYGYGRFDEDQNQVGSFTPFAEFTKDQWQVSGELPDPVHGWALLRKDGGHPGNNQEHAVIRRWTAPAKGAISITGVLKHESAKGDGVRARIVWSKTGSGEAWTASNGSVETQISEIEVEPGDHIDLVVDCRSEPSFDSFKWEATIRYSHDLVEATDVPRGEWNTAKQFAGRTELVPALTPWERLAQVLLVSNEFFFID